MKAETTVAPIIAILIVLSLVLLSFAVYPEGTRSLLEKFRILTPKNNLDDRQISPEMFRYDIEKDIVEYYDGEFWTDFKDSAKKINDKRVSYEGLYNDLSGYYYNTERSKEEAEKKLSLNSAIELENYLPTELCVEVQGIVKTTQEKGDIIIWLHNIEGGGQTPRHCADKIIGTFTIKTDLQISLKTVKEEIPIREATHPSLYEELDVFALSWRDSILTKPITLNYERKIAKDEYVSEQETFCASMIDKIYLVVDLSQPTEKESCVWSFGEKDVSVDGPQETSEQTLRRYFIAGLDLITDPESFPLIENANAERIFINQEQTGNSIDTKIYILTRSGDIRVEKINGEDPLVGSIENNLISITSFEGIDGQTISYLNQLNTKSYASLHENGIDYVA